MGGSHNIPPLQSHEDVLDLTRKKCIIEPEKAVIGEVQKNLAVDIYIYIIYIQYF